MHSRGKRERENDYSKRVSPISRRQTSKGQPSVSTVYRFGGYTVCCWNDLLNLPIYLYPRRTKRKLAIFKVEFDSILLSADWKEFVYLRGLRERGTMRGGQQRDRGREEGEAPGGGVEGHGNIRGTRLGVHVRGEERASRRRPRRGRREGRRRRGRERMS